MGCWENTRKACKSKAEGEWFTSFRVGYHAGKPIESVVYCLNLPELSKQYLCHFIKPVLQHYKYLTINNRTNCLFLPITETLIIELLKWEHAEIYRMLWAHNMPFQQKGLSIQNICYFWKIQDGGCFMFTLWVHVLTILLQTFVIHTDSSTFKLYFIAQDIKVGCAEPEEFWSPTWLLHVTFESCSPGQ